MGTAVNSVTGDLIKTKIGDQKAYESGWDAIFGNKNKESEDAVSGDGGGTRQDSNVADDGDLSTDSSEATPKPNYSTLRV